HGRADDTEQKNADRGQQEVRNGSGGGDDEVRETRVAGVAEIHRRRFGGAEDQPGRDVENQRDQNASDRIDGPQRVQADPSLVAGGRVAELKSAPRMGRFVEGDGKEDDRELNRKVDDLVFQSAANISD